MKIAVIGTGIAGNVVAYELARDHAVTVYEANDYVGGHTHTHEIEWQGCRYAVDTGFIVYNERTYPLFTRLLGSLGVASRATSMSFSVRCERSGLEYNGTSLNGLFAQRRNLLRPAFYRMIGDILRFNRDTRALLDASDDELTLGAHLRQGGYSRELIEHYVIPVAAAIWSADPRLIRRSPARAFARFFENHGLLDVYDRPTWRVVAGGSKRYVERLTAAFRHRIRLASPVVSVSRRPHCVEVVTARGDAESYDQVVVACHSDEALALLADPTPAEREVLGAIHYQGNDAVLHTDAGMLPRRRRAWAAWNYHIPERAREHVAVTYDMNTLQGLEAPVRFLVTLNYVDAVDPTRILRRMHYRHPVFTPQTVAAQARHAEINGQRRTYFCGAYWGYGFHEDGIASAYTVLRHMREHTRAQLPVRRTG